MLEVAHDNCKGLKLFYRLHKLLFDRGDSCLECFNRATKTVGLCQPVPVRYCTREKRFFFYLCWALQEGITKTGRGIYVSWLSQDLSFLVIATFSNNTASTYILCIYHQYLASRNLVLLTCCHMNWHSLKDRRRLVIKNKTTNENVAITKKDRSWDNHETYIPRPVFVIPSCNAQQR
jgi:hypothetical protein